MRFPSCLVVAAVLGSASAASAQLPLVSPAPLPPAQLLPAMPIQPMTVGDFVASFQPLPGKYEVLLVHPKTGCPVPVCFTLPPGCIRKVRVNGHKIEFVYKCQRDVVIRFLHNGNVSVRG